MPKNIDYLPENYRTSFGTNLKELPKKEQNIAIDNFKYIKAPSITNQSFEGEKVKKENETDIEYKQAVREKEKASITFKEEFVKKNLINILNSYNKEIKKENIKITPMVTGIQKESISFKSIKAEDTRTIKKGETLVYKKISYGKDEKIRIGNTPKVSAETTKEKKEIQVVQGKIMSYSKKIDFSEEIKSKGKKEIPANTVSKNSLSKLKVSYKDSFSPIKDALKNDSNFIKEVIIAPSKIKKIYFNPISKSTNISMVIYSDTIKESNKQTILISKITPEKIPYSKITYKDSFKPISDGFRGTGAFTKIIAKDTLIVKSSELTKLYVSYKDPFKQPADILKSNSNLKYIVSTKIASALNNNKINISYYNSKSVVSTIKISFSDTMKESAKKEVSRNTVKTKIVLLDTNEIKELPLTNNIKGESETRLQKKYIFYFSPISDLIRTQVDYVENFAPANNSLKDKDQFRKYIIVPEDYDYKVIPEDVFLEFNDVKTWNLSHIPSYNFQFIPLGNLNLNQVDDYTLADNNNNLKGNSTIYKEYTAEDFTAKKIKIFKEEDTPILLDYVDTPKETYELYSPNYPFGHTVPGSYIIEPVDTLAPVEVLDKQVNPKDVQADIFMFNILPYSLTSMAMSNLSSSAEQLSGNPNSFETLIATSNGANAIYEAGMNLKYLSIDEILILGASNFSTLATYRGIKVKEFLLGIVPLPFQPNSVNNYKVMTDLTPDGIDVPSRVNDLVDKYKNNQQFAKKIEPKTFNTDIAIMDGVYKSQEQIKDVYNFIKSTYRDQNDIKGEGTFKKVTEEKEFYFANFKETDPWYYDYIVKSENASPGKDQGTAKIKIQNVTAFIDKTTEDTREFAEDKPLLERALLITKSLVDEKDFVKAYKDIDVGGATVQNKVNSWPDFLTKRNTIFDLGYIAVFPTSEPTKNFKIPFQFNPKITEGGIAANYAATSFIGRIGAIQTYVNTTALTSASLDFSYHVTTDKNIRENDKSWDWLDNFDIDVIENIENLLRALTLPSFKRGTTDNAFEFSPPPMIRVMFGASNKENATNIFRYPSSNSYQINAESAKSTYRNFLVTNLTINKDLDTLPILYQLDNDRGTGTYVTNTAGFNVQMSLVEVTPNYKDILPDYADYWNDGKKLFTQVSTANKRFTSYGPQ